MPVETDLGLRLALGLSTARKDCAARGESFREWVDRDSNYSWAYAKKLADIGDAPNPALALEEMRKRAREAVARSRAKKQTRKSEVGAFPAAIVNAADALAKMSVEDARRTVQRWAADHGFVLLNVREARYFGPLEKFKQLGARSKMEFVNWACAEVGGRFVSALDEGRS